MKTLYEHLLNEQNKFKGVKTKKIQQSKNLDDLINQVDADELKKYLKQNHITSIKESTVSYRYSNNNDLANELAQWLIEALIHYIKTAVANHLEKNKDNYEEGIRNLIESVKNFMGRIFKKPNLKLFDIDVKKEKNIINVTIKFKESTLTMLFELTKNESNK